MRQCYSMGLTSVANTNIQGYYVDGIVTFQELIRWVTLDHRAP